MRSIFKICGACQDQGEIVMESLTLYICNVQRPSKAWWKLFSIWRILVLDQLEQRWSASPLFITLSSHWNQFILALRSPIKEVKKKENYQNFTANPPSTFSNSWIDYRCLKKGETCRRCHRWNTQKCSWTQPKQMVWKYIQNSESGKHFLY